MALKGNADALDPSLIPGSSQDASAGVAVLLEAASSFERGDRRRRRIVREVSVQPALVDTAAEPLDVVTRSGHVIQVRARFDESRHPRQGTVENRRQ